MRTEERAIAAHGTFTALKAARGAWYGLSSAYWLEG